MRTRLERLRLVDFRNYATLDLAPAPGLNVLVGANAQGKSNALEAIAMLATAKSFRATREGELVRTGADRAEIAGDAQTPAGTVRLRCTIVRSGNGTRKTLEVNGGPVGYARFLGRARAVTFVPADLRLVSGGPSLRRAFLNAALAQIVPTYYRDLALVTRVLAQKNALLRGAVAPDRDLLLAYNDELVAPAAGIMLARAAFVREASAATAEVYARWEGARERLDVRYAPAVPFDPEADAAAVRDAVAAALAEAVEVETRRRVALAGPHRDDLDLAVDGRSLAAYGSQGQQRTAVLALKVAEYETMRARTGDAPLLLLDDVLSELDAERAAGFLAAVGRFEQAFLTATEPPAGLSGAAAWQVRAATVTRC